MRSRGLLILVAAALSGCSMSVQNYRPSVTNVQSLRNSPAAAVTVTAFSAKDGDEARVTDIKMRGSTLTSPYGSFATYIEAALKQELSDAGKLNPSSPVTISGILLKNSVDGNGMTIGTADLEVEFTVRHGARVAYRKTHRAHHEWPSSFAGAIAIPAVQKNYHAAVQKLLASLFADKDFNAALTHKGTRT